MDEDGFWRLVDSAWAGEQNITPEVLDRLNERLGRLSYAEIDECLKWFDQAHRRAYRWDLWAAGYLIQDSMSDDGFTDFRSWLIAHGRTAYERALADPDTLAELQWRSDLEDMSAAELYAARIVDAWSTRHQHDPETGYWEAPQEEPAGDAFPEDDPEWFRRTFPRLWVKVNGDPGGSPSFGVLRIR